MCSAYTLEMDPIIICCINRGGTGNGNGDIRTRKQEMENREQHENSINSRRLQNRDYMSSGPKKTMQNTGCCDE